jgi:uncharacterized protein YeaO (DUF488 family)
LKDIWLHYEVVGWKDCHRWFVNNPKEWTSFKNKVKKEIENIKHPVQVEEVKIEGECKLEPLTSWQKEMGEKALDELTKEGIISNAEDWKLKLNEHVENWLFFEIIKRIVAKK